MKIQARHIRLLIGAATAVMVLGLAGCPLMEESISITARIDQLESDLNNDWNNVYTNWHPDSTTRQAAANSSALSTAFPESESGSYSFSNVSEGSSSATATLTSSTTYAGGRDVSFTMQQDGDDWFISSMDTGDTTLSTID